MKQGTKYSLTKGTLEIKNYAMVPFWRGGKELLANLKTGSNQYKFPSRNTLNGFRSIIHVHVNCLPFEIFSYFTSTCSYLFY